MKKAQSTVEIILYTSIILIAILTVIAAFGNNFKSSIDMAKTRINTTNEAITP